MAVVHQHYRNPQTQVLRLTVGVALVPVGALVTLTVNKLNVSLERIISRQRPNWKNTSQKRENSKNAPSGLPVRRRFRLGHLVEHSSYLLPVIKVLPLVIELQNDADNLQDLEAQHTQRLPYTQFKAFERNPHVMKQNM